MKIKTFVSPRLYDCGHWVSDKYYYEEKETGKRICSECYKKNNLAKASEMNKAFSGAIFGK